MFRCNKERLARARDRDEAAASRRDGGELGPALPGHLVQQQALGGSFPRGRRVLGGHRQCVQPRVHGATWKPEEKRAQTVSPRMPARSGRESRRAWRCTRADPELSIPDLSAVPVPSRGLPQDCYSLLWKLKPVLFCLWEENQPTNNNKNPTPKNKGRGKKKQKRKKKARASCGQDFSPPMSISR